MAVEMLAGTEQTVAAKAAKITDLNGDGQINALDCPHPHGTPEAKTWLKDVLDPYVKSQVTPEMKAKYGDKCTGSYGGKALVPGVKGSAMDPQGDFDYMSDKIQVTHGVDKVVADKIAAKIMYVKYPKAAVTQ